MTKINWKVRFNNKLFLTALASQTAVMIQGLIAGLVGLGIMDIDLSQLDNSLKISLGIVDTVLIYLSFLGIIKDPTTKGISDSEQAMEYEEPRE
ncbi:MULTISPECIES: phage holin [Bacillus]|uniref:Holin n=1 Tax=Bacillus glycinifermentans TaxID=1664069 RepID=A0A0T6BQB2_9BACI|nr:MULTISPECIES: phage holin [Bacillus]KRT93811.1 holin [Bacillus glycinifermentans]MDU0072018.1 phage holin [Bacillus sp. IG6]MEC0487384.1 phage holin [Bacillus glycinifermentans]MED8019724.1 phage holin [Bacillus glycinifermentans]QAT65182.1 phage holin [Bacillus glycinifermentans]